MAARDGHVAKQLAAQVYSLLGALGVDQRRITGDLHSLVCGADIQRNIERYVEAGTNDEPGTNNLRETASLGLYRVVSGRRQLDQAIVAFGVARRFEASTHGRTPRYDVDARHNCARTVGDAAVNGAIGRGLTNSATELELKQGENEDYKEKGNAAVRLDW